MHGRAAMLSGQRQGEILALLKEQGQVVAKALSERFGVSEDTIRRDLRELARAGSLQRVHGGALPVSPAIADFAKRQTIASEGKKAIAHAAAGLLEHGQVVLIDGGTTSVEMVRALPRDLQATVVTHSPSIAVELVDHESIEVILIGGRMFKHSVVTVGAAAREALSHVRADMFFMGVTGVHESAGFSTGDFEEAYMKRALSEHAAETIVLASSDKLGAASRYQIGELSLASALIVERSASEAMIDPLMRSGLTVIRA